jgi:hypothetical protein
MRACSLDDIFTVGNVQDTQRLQMSSPLLTRSSDSAAGTWIYLVDRQEVAGHDCRLMWVEALASMSFVLKRVPRVFWMTFNHQQTKKDKAS